MGLYFSQSLVPHALIENILQDAMLLDQIGSVSEWIEYPVKLRAQKIIMNAKRQELGVDMLIPRHIQLAASFEEYLLGWAYEEDKLNVPAVDYFKVRFKNKYQMLEAIKMANDQ